MLTKSILKIWLLSVNFENSPHKLMYGPITALQTLDYDWCKSIGLLVHFFAPDTHRALVVALSEKSKYHSVWL